MKAQRNFRMFRSLVAAAALLLASCMTTPVKREETFEINVTNDLTISSGEPQIAVDPTNPHNVAIVEFGSGSKEVPASTFRPGNIEDFREGIMTNTGRVMLSTDGGNHWKQGSVPAYDPHVTPHRGGGDPFIVYGPDGVLYVGDEAGPSAKATGTAKTFTEIYAQLMPTISVVIAASTDKGKTFGMPQIAGTPIDRPWMTADRTTGTVYTVSSGNYNPTTKAHNVPGDGAPNDRWLVAWKPRLAGKSEPRRLGGPDFSGSGGSTIAAAHGVVAATFVIGPGGFPGGPQPATPTPVPESLKSAITNGTTSCSRQVPCLFFETSTDQGEHWTRRHVPVAGGFSGTANVTADVGRPGRYAISVLNPARTNLLILVTDDSGATWSGPVTVPEKASGVDFKYWLDYGPSGVLGLVWKKQRDDVAPPAPPSGQAAAGAGPRSVVAPGFDVYAAISCDGGKTWPPPARMNAEPSPPGPAGNDDLSYISLDAKYAHMVWGDRRMLPKVTNVPGASGGLQAYYGRLPFSAVSNGAACGRK